MSTHEEKDQKENRERVIMMKNDLEIKLHNSLSNHQGLKTQTEVILFDRLLWLRNHYEFGKPELREQVLANIDAVIASVRSLTKSPV